MRDIQLIPGPLHPDLFGGETPIMIPCNKPLTEFSVEVCWPSGEEIECQKLTITALTHEEAAHQILNEVRQSTHLQAEVVDVQCHTQDYEPQSQTDPEGTGL